MKNNIYQIIENGENSKTEFKSSDFHSASLAKEIVAFSNMNGGIIYIGIEDSGKISGMQDSNIEEKVINICRNNIAPSIIPDIEMMKIENKKIMIIDVSKGRYKPYKLKTNNKYYIRIGSVSIEPSNEELLRLFQDGEYLHFEVSVIPNSSIADIDFFRFQEYCHRFRKIEFDDSEKEKLIYNLQLIEENKKPTIVGMLFFGINIRKYLPQAGIELNFFDGNDITCDILDFKSLDSDIPSLIATAEIFIKNNSRIKTYFNDEQTRRTDVADYKKFVVRELVVNAFMHRDWSIFGQRVKVNLFSDRLEFFSPGKLPNTINLNRALSGISYYRNPIISQMLKDYGLAEKIGRGLQKIVKFYNDNKLKIPKFDANLEYFKVIVFNANG